jgi:hypothetical protein
VTASIATLVPLAFVAVWLLGTGIASLLSGWHALAEQYPEPDGFEAPPERRHRFRTVQFVRLAALPARYGSSVTVTLAPGGLHLAVLAIFRFRHPPLLIPWGAIRDCEEGSFFGFRYTEVEVRDADPVIRIFGGVGDEVAAEWRRHGPSGNARR